MKNAGLRRSTPTVKLNPSRKLYAKLRRDAESNYTLATAALYRQADEAGKDSVSHAGKCQIIRDLSGDFNGPIRMLDLGCGTGRYFHCARNVRTLIGVDPSESMLLQARRSVAGGNRNVRLIRSTLHEVAFKPGTFDLVICVGVLGEWCPVDDFVLKRIAEMLNRTGCVFFTAIEYRPVPLTWKRRLASAIRPLLFGAPRRYVDARLRPFDITEERVRALGRRYFEQVTITRWQSPTTRVDLHCVMAQPRTVATPVDR